ncbi:AAA family ATPase [Propionibacterium freudenreichii]|uniref:AAA family ATPase n=1 Tax=Propionibacterium freudenreichii TaxID=1744 RepID=UPI00054350C4|nr:AAA family ATPase [Propionibacterium freudenreichii]MCT2993216.1 AAA family ATPase [Propionibacterium freudenreichii]MDK9658660.1 AAA family ATPase [Propionibacterium freudenreichii]MDK9663590.1 AAA family ATPase [Propionibacterium freudenreichii]CEG94307.1 ATPase [Propionibacterium freudenreichii]
MTQAAQSPLEGPTSKAPASKEPAPAGPAPDGPPTAPRRTDAAGASARRTLDSAELARATELLGAMTRAFERRVVGQDRLLTALQVALMSGGHVLLESVPGLAKTLAASTLASTIDGSFSRIQCTPDLLPFDIIGTQIYDARTGGFTTQLGPVHANIVLLDEVNRSSAKTQSAMLEAMQERQTTIGDTSYPLPDPFMVLATQNPIEEEGTYVLPHAQMDRFLLKEVIDYPSADAELEVLDRLDDGRLDAASAPPVVTTDQVLELQSLTRRVYIDERLKRYIVEVVNVTRDAFHFLGSDIARYIDYGSSPRGSLAFLEAAKAGALLAGRDHVLPEDIKAMRHPVLRHRIVLTFEAIAEQVHPETIIDAVFDAVPTP